MTYNVFICRVKARMLGLRHKLSEAPFLEQYFEVSTPEHGDLGLSAAAATAQCLHSCVKFQFRTSVR